MYSQTRDWLKELKVGDKVIIRERRDYSRIALVEKVNKTTIKVNGRLFYKEFGYERCDFYARPFLVKATEEEIARVKDEDEKRSIVSTLSRLYFEQFSLETLRQVKAVLNKEKKI